MSQRKLVLFIAASLDGYIAKEDDSLDWLYKAESRWSGDNGIHAFYETVDTILIGRKTYDQILILENGDFPYKNKECYIFSRDENQKIEYGKLVNGELDNFVNELKQKPGKNIWLVGGGELFHSFLKQKLIEELIITIVPAIIGKGIPLFQEDDHEQELKLTDINRYNQFVQLTYEVLK